MKWINLGLILGLVVAIGVSVGILGASLKELRLELEATRVLGVETSELSLMTALVVLEMVEEGDKNTIYTSAVGDTIWED